MHCFYRFMCDVCVLCLQHFCLIKHNAAAAAAAAADDDDDDDDNFCFISVLKLFLFNFKFTSSEIESARYRIF